MSYIRKTRDVFILMWQGEEVDEFDSYIEARLMLKEYNLAYGGGVWMCKKRIKINA
jgi:hypothetical protein